MGAEFWITLLFRLVIIPLAIYVAKWAVALFKAKTEEHIAKIDNANAQRLLNEAVDIISTCVLATTQTYVDALKKQDKFDLEAQKEALKITTDMAITMLPDETKAFIEGSYGDLDQYVINTIEAKIAQAKG